MNKHAFQFETDELNIKLYVKPKSGTVTGITSMTEDGYHILMADYDEVPLELIQFELKAIQTRYNLCHIYLLESSPGHYHALCFSKITWPMLKEILAQLHCDPGYKLASTQVLRTSTKNQQPIKLHSIIESNKCAGELSLAHETHYKPILKTVNPCPCLWDNNTKLISVEYNT